MASDGFFSILPIWYSKFGCDKCVSRYRGADRWHQFYTLVDNEESFEHHVIELYVAVCCCYVSLSLSLYTSQRHHVSVWKPGELWWNQGLDGIHHKSNKPISMAFEITWPVFFTGLMPYYLLEIICRLIVIPYNSAVTWPSPTCWDDCVRCVSKTACD